MTGMMAGADPTAPGGMSQKALAAELVDQHGWTKTAVKPFMVLAQWPSLMDAVIQERAMREHEAAQARSRLVNDGVVFVCDLHETENCAECNGVAKAHDESLADDRPEASELFTNVDGPQIGIDYDGVDDIDPDALMAELTSTRDEHEAEVRANSLLVPEPGTMNYMFDGHAGAGPSASERWLTCTASVGASREFLETLTPNQQALFANSNEAARQGTTAHSAAEVEARVILGELTEEEASHTLLELSVLPESEGEAYSDEMGEYIGEYVDLVRSYIQERGSENVLIEQRVSAAIPLTGNHEGEVYEIPGSVDCGVLPTPEEPVLVSADLKYGEGIWVGVDENSQAMIYALALLALMVNDEGRLPEWLKIVRLHIIQPRMDGIKTAEMSVDDLLDWRDEVLAPALTKALYGQAEGATFVPTTGGCQFCPARGGCAALAEDRMAAAADLFDVQVDAEYNEGPGAFPETTQLTDTRLGELLAQVAGLIDIHKDLKAEAERRLYRGDSIPGWQLVNYTPPRKWKEGSDEAFDNVPELWTKKMMTPTQAVKMAEANAEEWDIDGLKEWIDVPDKRPVVAKEGDRRKTWEGKPPEAMFDDETGADA